MLKRIFFFLLVGCLFAQNSRASSATAVRAEAGQLASVTDKLLPDTKDLGSLAKKLEDEKKTPLVSPDTYKKPVQKQENTPTFILKAIHVSGNRTIKTPDLKACWADYIGKKVSFNELSDIAYAITKIYRHQGYFISYAVIPEQNINVEKGEVSLRVIEGYIDKIEIQKIDKSPISERVNSLADYFRGRPLDLYSFERGMLLIRDLYPHSRVFFEASDVRAEGATCAKVVIPAQRKISGSAAINNYGTNSVGPVLYNVGLSVTPPWGEEDKIDLTYQQALRARELKYGIVGYTTPLGDEGASAKLQGSAQSSHPTAILNYKKHQRQITGMVLYPFARSQEFNMYGGTELKYLNQTQIVTDFNQITKERVRQIKLLGLLDWADSFAGQNSLQFRGISGLPVLNPIGKNDPHKSRPTGSGKPLYFEMTASRLQRLVGPFSVRFHVDGQYAARALLSIDRFYSDGPPVDGAYPASAMAGDSGVEGKVELIYHLMDAIGLDDVQFFTYFSQIKVWNRAPASGAEKFSEVGKGAGIGVRATYNNLTGSLEYGYPIIAPVGGNSVNPRIIFSLAGRI